MITANIYHRVFQLWAGRGSGTAFTIEVDGRQYLVTAKHVLDGVAPGDLKLTHEGRRQPLGALQGLSLVPDADVAIIAAQHQLAPALAMEPSSEGMVFGQDAYFLGFPFGIAWDPGALNRGFPLPLIKKAVISGEMRLSVNHRVLVLDGHNNEGFSGGPVVLKRPGSKSFQAVGIVTGYQARLVDVVDGANTKIGRAPENTGLMFAEDISIAVEAARSLASGPKVTPRGGKITPPTT